MVLSPSPIRTRNIDPNSGQMGPVDPFDPNPDPFLAKAPPPVDVRVRIIDGTTLQVSWKDVKATNKFHITDYWSVIICDDASISGSSGDTGFSDKVIRFGVAVDNRSSNGKGDQYVFESHSTVLISGWVLVVGYSLYGDIGIPSTPIHFDLSNNVSKSAPDDGSFSMGYDVTRINSVDTLNLYIAAIPPADTSIFAGWHLHMKGYNALTQYTELASLQYPSTDSGISKWTLRLPMEGGQGNGVATFSGTNVTRVSGDNFLVGWVGRLIYVRDVATGTTVLTTVASWASSSSMTTGAALTAGTWTYRVLNTLTFRLVSVSTNGARNPDVEHSGVPTITL